MSQTKLQNNVDIYGLSWIDYEEAKEIYKRCWNRENGRKIPFEEFIGFEQVNEIEAQAFFHTFKHAMNHHKLDNSPNIRDYLPTPQDMPEFTEHQRKLITLYRLIDKGMQKDTWNRPYTIGEGFFNLKGSYEFNNEKISDRLAIRMERGNFWYIDVDNYKPNTKFSHTRFHWDVLSKKLDEKNIFLQGPVNFLAPGYFCVLPIRGVTEIINVLGNNSCRYNKQGKHKIKLSKQDYSL